MAKIIPDVEKQILSTAKEIVSTQGIDALSMRSVSQNCGIALGTIYNYFPTKADILAQLMAGYWDDFLKEVESYLNEPNDIFVALRHIYDLQCQFVGIFRMEWLVPSFYKTAENVQKAVNLEQSYLQKFTQQIENLIYASQEAGCISPKRDIHKTAQYIQFNMMALSRQNVISYDLFEGFLKELI